MKILALLLGTATLATSLVSPAAAQTAMDAATLTCAEFSALDGDGMMKASETMSMAADQMTPDDMASDDMAADSMTGDAMTDDTMASDTMAADAMASDTMADDAMASDDMTAAITAACAAHPDGTVRAALDAS